MAHVLKIFGALILSAPLALPAGAEPLNINPFPLDAQAAQAAVLPTIPLTIPSAQGLRPAEREAQSAPTAPVPVTRFLKTTPKAVPMVQPQPAPPAPVDKTVEIEAMPLPVPQTGADRMPPPSVEMPIPAESARVQPQTAPAIAGTSGTAKVSSPWLAYAGADLREVLAHWSRRAGIEIVWSSGSDFPVLATLELGGSYEEAVRILLQQYDGQYIRPVGTLHQRGGRRALVIQALDDDGIQE